MTMDFPLARQRLYQVVRQPEAEINLAEAALYIAQEHYPDLEVDSYLNALDTMAAEVQERLPTEAYPLRVIQTINQYLYQDLGFVGNAVDYYDPRNSFLNEVIERRTGIPITLSLVYLEIAQRIDFPMFGIGMPGHFLIRPKQEEMEIFVDPFHGGEILFSEDCHERLAQFYGRPMELQPQFIQPVSSRQFLVRMLTNLKHIYLSQSEWLKSLAAIEQILITDPNAVGELRDRGTLYYQLGRWSEACQDLEAYLASNPPVEDIDPTCQLLSRMQKKI